MIMNFPVKRYTVSLKLNKATYTSTGSRFHRGAELPGKPNALESNPITGGQFNLLEFNWENQLGRALLEFRVRLWVSLNWPTQL